MVTDKADCDDCKRLMRTRGIVRYKDGYYCRSCYKKRTNVMGGPNFKLRHVVDDSKVRNVMVGERRGRTICLLSLPMCYAGKKVRVVVVEEGEDVLG